MGDRSSVAYRATENLSRYSLPSAPLICSQIRNDKISGNGVVYPERIMRGGGVISRKGCLGAIFVFSVCMYVCIFGGVEVEC